MKFGKVPERWTYMTDAEKMDWFDNNEVYEIEDKED